MKSNQTKKMKKRILALLLCMVMMLNGSVSALASEVAVANDAAEAAHVHGEECYTRTKVSEELKCGKEVVEGHTHGDTCYEVTNTPECICTLEETEGHSHDDSCFETEEIQVCTLEEHEHGDGCYTTEKELTCGQEESEEHTHDDGCYKENAECICEIDEHSHGSDCYITDTKNICGQEEKEAHSHGDACYTAVENKTLTCQLEEIESHTHGDECYEWLEELVCEIEAEELVPEEISEETVIVCETCQKEKCECEKEVENSLIQTLGETTVELSGAEEAFEAEKTYALQVNELEEEAAVMVAAAIKDVTRTANLEVLDYQAFDITLTADEEAAQPKAEVEVKFTGAKIEEYVATEAAEVKAFHVDAEGNAEEVSLTEGENEVAITTDHFSTYVVANVKTAEPVVLTTEVDGTTITLSGPVSAFAEGKTYEITAAKVEAEEELEVIEEALEEVAEEQEKVIEGYQAFDIKIIEKDETGTVTDENFQPLNETPVQVMFSGNEVAESVANEETEVAVYWIDGKNSATNMDAVSDGTNVAMETEHFSVYVVTEMSEYQATYEELDGEFAEEIGETADMSGWYRLKESGWFEEYSEEAERIKAEEAEEKTQSIQKKTARRMLAMNSRTTPPPSDVQVVERGGSRTFDDGAVTVSKTIVGTELENILDITLKVQTKTKIEELYEDPDMAVVIVMDISQTMAETYSDKDATVKYKAAIEAADQFVDLFANNNTTGVSKIGFVAFNTNGHKICDLQSCYTKNQAIVFKDTMRTESGSIINGYGDDDPERYTNIEAGLKMAQDMLKSSTNRNKYILFLSDGLPTTYISSGYNGYNPNTDADLKGKDGYFYDNIYKKSILYGTNYSDRAAQRAEAVATSLKESGVKVFAVGAGLNTFKGTDFKDGSKWQGLTGVEMIVNQLRRAAPEKGVATIDTYGTNGSATQMSIGSLNDSLAFEKWLGNKIGSGYDGYYYETTDRAGLLAAYNGIFAKIKHDVEESSQADWVSRDPIPTVSGSAETVEFIGFYNKARELVSSDLSGEDGIGKENTATFDNAGTYAIEWDLKDSGYQTSTEGSVTQYTYQLVYRVRLKNENQSFTENYTYPTNDPTSLTYRFVESVDGSDVISDPKTVNFPIPAVKGYLGELQFQKIDNFDKPVVGAEFTLAHDTESCGYCRGDESKSVTIKDFTATSNAQGNVVFNNIPSGHIYKLKETGVPAGYFSLGEEYQVTVAYDNLTVKLIGASDEWEWNSKIVNGRIYELPSTGGMGTDMFKISGLALMSGAALFLYKKKEDEEVQG